MDDEDSLVPTQDASVPAPVALDELTTKVIAALDLIAAIIPDLRKPHPATKSKVRGARTISREAVVSIIAMVEASDVLQSMKAMDTERAREVLQSKDDFRLLAGPRATRCMRIAWHRASPTTIPAKASSPRTWRRSASASDAATPLPGRERKIRRIRTAYHTSIMTAEAPVLPVPSPEPAPPPEPLRPASASERVETIDILRGLALFGILAANIRGFSGPPITYFSPSLFWPALHDTIAQAFIDTFVQGKFITIFAFLFGVGFAVQFERASSRTGKFGWTYARRQVLLLLIVMVSPTLVQS